MKSGYRFVIAHKTWHHSWQMKKKKYMKPQVIPIIEKENKNFIILCISIHWVDAVILDNDTTNHSWMTL